MICKWMDNRSVLFLLSALEGMNDILSVQRREKSSKTNSSVPCPKVVKLCNSGMGGVDLMDQRTAVYRLDRKSSVRFYLQFFFDLIWWISHMPIIASFITWNILRNCPSFQKYRVQYHQDWKMIVPMSRPSKKKNQPESIDNHGGHLPDYQTMQKRGANCAMAVKENRTFIIVLACNIPLTFQ